MTVAFDDLLGRTVLTMRMVFATSADRDAAVEKYHAVDGGNQTLDRLGVHLEST